MNDTFTFTDYHFDVSSKKLSLHYNYGKQKFTEVFRFDFDFADYDLAVLDRAIQQLFFIAGVSYYKVYAAPRVAVSAGNVDKPLSEFLSRTYQKGLGEFYFVNQMDPTTRLDFPTNSEALQPVTAKGSGLLVGIGGGKDSLVTIEQLRGKADKLATWSVNHRPQLEPLVERIGLPHYWVERQWDKHLLDLNAKPDTYNGHVPISAILAAVGTVVAVLAGFRDVVVSNEQSANEPTLHFNGVDINHQYSKSQEFETDYQALLAQHFGDSLRYYSFLRPLSELRIAEIFANTATGFEKYHDVFCSCNRAFTHESKDMFWDAECAKCAFIFLSLTPFVEQPQLEELFGVNMLLDPDNDHTYRQLLGIEGDKPLDCVGEVKESRAAMRLAYETYPQLRDRFVFDMPAGYDYKQASGHSMPAEIRSLLQA